MEYLHLQACIFLVKSQKLIKMTRSNLNGILFLIVMLLLPAFAVGEINIKRLSLADSLINVAIKEKTIPGGVLAVVHKSQLVYIKAYGNKAVYPDVEPMTIGTVFDLASVTKPFTALSVMILAERGELNLDDPARRYLPYMPKDIKIINLLTHTSGIPDYSDVATLIKKYGTGNRKGLEEYIMHMAGKNKPGEVFEYSCLNYVALQFIVEKISGKSLQDFTQENIFKPLRMDNTSFNPKGETLKLCAPTEKQKDGSVLRGVVHDSLSQYLNNGISGNAGLFSNAHDLVILVKMLLNNGELNGTRILSALSCEVMRTVPKGYEKFGRSLGWDNYSTYSSDHGNFFDRERTYGHTGYTGPGIFIDPVNETAVIFLAHRVHPNNVGSMVPLRAKLANIIAGSIE